jgi:hypothetical protein
MYKITKGNREEYANTYMKAEKIFRRLCKNLYQCGAITRLYCDIGNGYQLMRVGGRRIENALIPEHA